MDRHQRLRYPVHKVTGPIDKAIPSLFESKEFKALRKHYGERIDQVVCYIVLLYDKGTDLVDEFPSDLKARKEAAATEAGFERQKNDKWPADVQSLMDARTKVAVEAIMWYLKDQRHNLWLDIVVTEQELYDFQKLRFSGLDTKSKDRDIYEAAKKKGLLMEECNKRTKVLEGLYEQFYGDNRDIQKAEFREMITPENAVRILETMPPPYQEGPVKQTADVQANP